MKLNPYFSLQQIGGSTVLLPSGKTGWRNHGVIQLNNDEAIVVRYLIKETTEEYLVSKLPQDVAKPEEEIKSLVKAVINKLNECGAITE
ncbi:MAG: hypothetical protein IJK71_11385 [Clostridia bacterium]|nr:hypothetical protein [Clostridia bacterium]